MSLRRLRRSDEAGAALRRAVELNPRSVAAHNNLGLILADQGRHDEAAAAYRRAIELDPRAAAPPLNLGVLLEGQGRREAAAALFREAIELEPGGSLAYHHLARILSGVGRIDEAIESLERLAESRPDEHDAWNRSAILRAQTDDRAGYRHHCRRMLEQFGLSSDPAIAERTAKACLLLPLGGPEQDAAYRLADRAVGISGGHWVLPWAEATMGLADYRRGRFAQAVAAADSCLSRGPGNWNCELPSHLVRAMALSRLGRGGEAQAVLNRASELYQRCAARPVGSISGGDWPDLLIAEILLREAEALILDSTFPANPFGD
jgi:Flp pilus assembly protein TadD